MNGDPSTNPQQALKELLESIDLESNDLELLDPVPPSQLTTLWPWLLSAVLTVLIIAAITVWLLRRRRRPTPISPEKLARFRLARLQDDPDRLSGGGFAHAVATIIRDYLTGTGLAPAGQLTASELAAVLAGRSLAGDPAKRIVALLESCDEYRFANAEMSEEDRDRLAAEAAEIIGIVELRDTPESEA